MKQVGSTRRRVTATLVLLLAGSAGGLAGAWQQSPEEEDGRPVKLIKMTASNWKWMPELIRVPEGTRLRIEFKSYDASHSFVLKAYGIKTPLPEGSTAEVEFVADRKGKFKWRCGRPCGNGCAKMVGTLIVE